MLKSSKTNQVVWQKLTIYSILILMNSGLVYTLSKWNITHGWTIKLYALTMWNQRTLIVIMCLWYWLLLYYNGVLFPNNSVVDWNFVYCTFRYTFHFIECFVSYSCYILTLNLCSKWFCNTRRNISLGIVIITMCCFVITYKGRES